MLIKKKGVGHAPPTRVATSFTLPPNISIFYKENHSEVFRSINNLFKYVKSPSF